MFVVADKTFKVKEVAELTGLSVRALHHYDAIGLVSPEKRTSAGYRLYTEADLVALQQVLVYRELGLPLERIKQIVNDPAFDRQAAFEDQRRQLEHKLENTHAMLRAVDKALAALKGVPIMNAKELFDGFDPAEYEEEAKERWGDTDAYKESARRTKGYGPEEWKALKAENDEIMSELAKLVVAGGKPTDEAAMDLAERHRLHIDRWFYPCAHAMHRGLGQMYVADERFTQNIDKFGEGVAALLSAAIEANADRQ